MHAVVIEPCLPFGPVEARFGGFDAVWASGPVSLAPSKSDLILAIAERGDRAAFTALFNHFAPRVKAYMLRMGADAGTAEELAQETLLTVWRRAGAFNPKKAQASTWIFAIARNLRIDLARRERRPLPGEDRTDAPLAQALPDAEVGARQQARRIELALADLPEPQAQVIRLAFFSDKPHTEIAGDLALPLGTVKSRLRLAMGRLRAALEEGS